jgi:hypothetical protein
MLSLKSVLSFLSVLIFTFCSSPAEKQGLNNNDNLNASNDIWGVWGGGNVSPEEMSKYSFLKGWYIVYQWKQLEPSKNQFDWNYFDSQMKFAADHNLSIGFMVWVGPHSPQWLYANGVPRVETQTKKKMTDFPYYLNPYYKERYFNMLKQVAAHLQQLPGNIRNKVVMWMSAEGSTGDVVPYKGKPQDAQYDITDQQWFDFKKDVWSYLYKVCEAEKPKIHLLINQGNSGQYFNWLAGNLPKVWMKAGNISHTYQFNGELEYYNRLKKLESKIAEDSMSARLRGEITVQGQWFNKNESWNMYALLTAALHFGLDIFNTTPKYWQNPVDTITFNFFNFYAGQKNARKSPGAFCVFRDGLDAADTQRFPEATYGPVVDAAKMDAYKQQLARKSRKDASVDDEEDNSDEDGSDEGINESNAKNDNLSATRVDKILQEFAAYGARRGDVNFSDSSAVDENENGSTSDETTQSGKPGRSGRNPNRVPRNPNKQGGRKNKSDDGGKGTAYQKRREANMVDNDIGVNLIPDNYYKFLKQYSPNTTSRGYWRVGPGDEPYGRFARAFDAQHGMNEMFFALDKNFFSTSANVQHATVRIIYLDKGNGGWSLNYFNGKNKTEAYQVKCGNSGRWTTKTVEITDAYFTQKLEHNCDLSIKYLSGDNTIFNSIEVLR